MPDETSPLTRRAVLKVASTLTVGSAMVASGLLVGCGDGTERGATAKPADGAPALSPDEAALVGDVADTILPTTPSSPGASAAGVAAIATLLLTDCHDAAAQERVRSGLRALRERCDATFDRPFARLSPSEREQLLRDIDRDASVEGETHWFPLVRALVERAYFSSEIGMTKALRYVRVPGRWDGCVPLAPGQPAWG